MPRKNKIIIRTGTTVPVATDFVTGEPAYNSSTGVFYVKTGAGSMAAVNLLDGDKGDITVNNSGATWTINANAVVTADIANSNVTYAKIQNVSATDRLLGRSTAGAGVIEEIPCTQWSRNLLQISDNPTARDALGLGTISTQAANSVAISGGAVNSTTIGATTASTGAFTTLGATGVITTSLGAVGAPAIAFTGDTNTGTYSPGADQWAVTTGGGQRLHINSTGDVGIGTAATASVRLNMYQPAINQNGYVTHQVFADPVSTANGAYTHFGAYYVLRTDVAAGVTDTGAKRGLFAATLRNNKATNNTDAGTLTFLRGAELQYGHGVQNTAITPTTTAVTGLFMSPLAGYGTITDMYDLYIAGPAHNLGTVGNHYAIYQAGTTVRNYFAGNVGIGATNPGSKLEVLPGGGQGINCLNNGGAGTVNYALMGQAAGVAGANTGVYVNAYNAATNYGVRIVNPPAAAGNWAIYSDAAAKSYHLGNVGIGASRTNPSSALDVNGVITVAAGTVSAPAVCFSGYTNTGIYAPAADTVAITTGGVERLRVASDGLVTAGGSPVVTIARMLPHLGGSISSADVYPRTEAVNGTVSVSSGNAFLVFFTPLQTITVSQITMVSGTSVAASGLTFAQMGLYTYDETTATLVARTASDTTLFTTINTAYTRAFNTAGGYPATYTLQAGTRYGVAVLLIGTTMSVFAGKGVPAGLLGLTPKTAMSINGQTALPASSTALQITASHPFARLS